MTTAVNGTNKTYYPELEQSPSKLPSQDMDKDAFLQILVNQLRNQDPLNPQDNDKFIAQMTQFSVLEQLTNMNAKLDDLYKVMLEKKTDNEGGENVQQDQHEVPDSSLTTEESPSEA